jgi:hypothetical protein
MHEVVERSMARDLLVSVNHNGKAESEAKQQRAPWLKVIEKSRHKIFPRKGL